MDVASLINLLILIFGFGFVIFWHELGHFLAAKWAGVRVEQFAVGFGQAMLCWRKGIGVRVGSTAQEYETRAVDHLVRQRNQSAGFGQIGYTKEQIDAAARELGLGETEYRLNWIPLGGYVKMLGQDDLDPNSKSPDERAFNNKPIAKRMLIVSAGVAMNVILAGLLFCALFLYGFSTPAPVIGSVAPGSPAQRAGLRAGDRILAFDGAAMHDFTKIRLAAALVHPSEPAQMTVRHGDTGATETVRLQALPNESESSGFLQIGIGPAASFSAPADFGDAGDPRLTEPFTLRPGDQLLAVGDVRLPPPSNEKSEEHEKLAFDRAIAAMDKAVQSSGGRPVRIEVRGKDGTTRALEVRPELPLPFGRREISFAGMTARPTIESIQEGSSVVGRLLPGDVVTRLVTRNAGADTLENPSGRELRDGLGSAGASGLKVDLTVLRDGKSVQVSDLDPNTRLKNQGGRRGLGISIGMEWQRPMVSEVLASSPAAKAGIVRGSVLHEINGEPVDTWYAVQQALGRASPGAAVPIRLETPSGVDTILLDLPSEASKEIADMRYYLPLELNERIEDRQTKNPALAMAWGMGETRDLIVQFYVTLKRMLVQRSVSLQSMSGPVGILDAGTKIASRGADWIIWYLAMISANLAVVNFLPIPIVDGGLFVFLILEKLRGRPVSPKVLTITQFVGLALILCLFLFVTYNDIMRILL